jgi:parallel beta helix pectate lyase-like protein
MIGGALRGTNKTGTVALALLLLLLTRSGVAASLADFTKCIGPQGQGPVCQLDTGTYVLSLPLQMGRSNITVKGTIQTSRADTTLRRTPGSKRGLLVNYLTGLSSITVRDFTFDGAGDQQTGDTSSIEAEVRFNAVKSLLLTNAAFINSPNIALTLEETSAQNTSGAVINNILIDGAPRLGVIALAYGSPGESAGQYLTCDSRRYSTDIKITNSTFRNVGANAIALEAKGVQVTNNTLQHNHATAPYNAPGGQIYVEICADDVAILNNTITDGPVTPNGKFADGLELHGTNVVAVDNTITNNAGSGISMSGVQNLFIANWTSGTGVISNNLLAGFAGGISLYNAAPGNPNERPVDYITIDHAVSINDQQFAGIGTFLQTPQMNPINHVTLTNNCLAGNLQGATQLFGLGSNVVIANNTSSGCPK